MRPISLRMALKSMRSLETFIPPPVEPAEAPTIISSKRMDLLNMGHRWKSVVANPVVVIMDDTWNDEYLRAVKNEPPYMGIIFPAIRSIEDVYKRQSRILQGR